MITGRGRRASQAGFMMAALLVMMSVMAIALSVALPVFQNVARREREAELVFRGEQYARAIRLFQQRYANAFPPDVDVLVNERFLRRRYTDPITGGDFKLLGPGSPELAEALTAAPVDADAGGGRGAIAFVAGRGGGQGFRGRAAGPFQPAAATRDRVQQSAVDGQAPGGIVAVTSSSTRESIRLYNGKGHYNEWIFMALQASVSGGAPPGAGELGLDSSVGGAAGARGRGGRAGVRGGIPPARGRSRP